MAKIKASKSFKNRIIIYYAFSNATDRSGENAALQYSIDLNAEVFGFIKVEFDANFGRGKLNVDFTTMPGKYLNNE